jgi:hypothetical protein
MRKPPVSSKFRREQATLLDSSSLVFVSILGLELRGARAEPFGILSFLLNKETLMGCSNMGIVR